GDLLSSAWPLKKILIGFAASAALLSCVIVTRHQLHFWRDGVALFEHAIAVIPNNYLAESFLGNEFRVRGDIPKATQHYRRSIEIAPAYSAAHYNLGGVLADQDQ